MRREPLLFCAAILFVAGIVFGAEEDSDIKIIPHGFAYYQIGQIEQMTPPDPSLMIKNCVSSLAENRNSALRAQKI
jgi:hypothetical protein